MTDARPPAAEPAPETRPRLTRSRQHKVVSGVCGGLGRRYDLDPVIFRVPLVVLSVTGGLGLLFYGFAWLFVPLEGEDENEVRRLLSGRVEGTGLSALLCALVGCGLFLASLAREDGGTQMFSVMLAGAVAGAAHWSQHRRRAAATETGGPVTAQAVADAPPEPKAPPAPAGPSWWREPLTKGDGSAGEPYGTGTGYLWGPEDTPSGGAYAGAGTAGTGTAPGPGPVGPFGPAGPVAPRRRTSIGGLVFLLALAAAVVGTAATWSAQPLGTALAIGFGCALGVFGLGVAVSAFYGRVGGGTLFAIMCTGVLLAGSLALPRDITTDWADATWRPVTAEQIEERYHVGTGAATLDLSGMEFGQGRTLRTAVHVGAGEARVIVPDDIEVELTVKVGGGGYRLVGRPGDEDWSTRQGGGIGVSEQRILPPAGGEPNGTLELRLQVGVGEAVIVQHPGERPERPAEAAEGEGW